MINSIRKSDTCPPASGVAAGHVVVKASERPAYRVALNDGVRYVDLAQYVALSADATLRPNTTGKLIGLDSTTGLVATLPAASELTNGGTLRFVIATAATTGEHSLAPQAGDQIVGWGTSLSAGDPFELTSFAVGDSATLTSNGDGLWYITGLLEGALGQSLEADAVTSTKIADGAVTTAKVDDEAITTAKVADGAITTAKLDVPKVSVLTESVAYDDFTDGGAAVGTFALAGEIPAGAILLGSKVLVGTGFTGDTSATLIIGDGTDTDRYMTGTPSIFTTAASGIQTGVPSGNKLVTAANHPVLTVTSAADFTSVGAGVLTVALYYIETV